MKISRKKIKRILTIALLLPIIYFFFYFIRNSPPVNTTRYTEDTSSWEKYNDSMLEFSFSYPSKFKTLDQSNSNNGMPYILLVAREYNRNDPLKVYLGVEVEDVKLYDKTYFTEMIIGQEKRETLALPHTGLMSDASIKRTRNVQIDKVEAYVFIIEEYYPHSRNSIEILAIKDGLSYTFTLMGNSSEIQIFHQILSTFKF